MNPTLTAPTYTFDLRAPASPNNGRRRLYCEITICDLLLKVSAFIEANGRTR